MRAASAVLPPALALVGATALVWFMGLDVVHALALGAAVAALIGLRRLPAADTPQDWPNDSAVRSDAGARREVARLSWSIQGYESRVQSLSVRRLHDVAAYRLGERGLDLDDPRDFPACQTALGERAYRVVSEPGEQPWYADFVAAVAAVERLTDPTQSTGRAQPTGQAQSTGEGGRR